MTNPRRSSWLPRLLAVSLSLLAADQLVLRTALADGEFLGQIVAPFERPLFSRQQRQIFAEYRRLLSEERAELDRRSQFDPVLGWCPRPESEHAGATFDWSGSRLGAQPLPRARAAGQRLVGLVGCSFTLGSEVPDEATWAYALDEAWDDTHFGNFGVGGYGMDQALVRYRRDVAPLAPDEVWLGFFPETALRATSQFPPLYYRWRARTVFFKPRFRLVDGELELRPSPAHQPEDIVRLIESWSDFRVGVGDDDPWIARAPAAYAEQGSRLSHHFAFARLALTFHERRGRDFQALLADEDGDAFALNLAIFKRLRDEVELTGARFRVLLIPGLRELLQLRDESHGYWNAFLDALRAERIEVLDLTPGLLAAGVDDSPRFWMPGGHHSPRTHRHVAELVTNAWRSPDGRR